MFRRMSLELCGNALHFSNSDLFADGGRQGLTCPPHVIPNQTKIAFSPMKSEHKPLTPYTLYFMEYGEISPKQFGHLSYCGTREVSYRRIAPFILLFIYLIIKDLNFRPDNEKKKINKIKKILEIIQVFG